MGDRLTVLKTYKIYIGGKFPRTESGRYYSFESNGSAVANICLGSRKDLRNAVVAARSAQEGWAGKTAYNRSQILYRIAEMMESRISEFIETMVLEGHKKKEAEKLVEAAIDRVIYFAGWCDKFLQVFGTVNPVSSSHFNFSTYESMGVIGVVAPKNDGILGLVSQCIPIIAGGNTCVVLADKEHPMSSITFAEVLATSDVPGGVINIITGESDEMLPHMVGHMDVNAVALCNVSSKVKKMSQETAINNLKRVRVYNQESWIGDSYNNPYAILDFQEVKTTWHPVEKIGGAGSGY